jgi:hypothetical protein
MIVEDCPDAKKCNVISTFADLVVAESTDGLFDFRNLQQRRFMKFWQNLCITRLVNEHADYEIVLWGSELTKYYGKDLTGNQPKHEDLGDAFETLSWYHYRAIKGKQVSFLSGTLGWENKDYVKWHQIFVPMLKNNHICCLSLICFS